MEATHSKIVTYDRAVYRVSVKSTPGTKGSFAPKGFKKLVRQTEEVGSEDTSVELLDTMSDGDLVEYLVVVHADASVHPVIQERFGSFGDGPTGMESRVEGAHVTVGVDKPEE